MKLLLIALCLPLAACTTVQVQEAPKYLTCKTVKVFAKTDILRITETSFSACKNITGSDYERVTGDRR